MGTTALVAALSVLSGCVVGPDYQAPKMALADKWHATGAAKTSSPALAQWWQRLNDPILNDLVEKAVASNLDVAKAKASIREARATTRQEYGSLLPSVSGSSSATRDRGQVSGSEPTVYSQYQAGFDASWEIDLFGSTRRGVEAAKYGEQVTEEQLRDTLVTLVGDVASYYVQAREYQLLTALAQRSAKSQRETARLTREQIDAGIVSRVDVAKAEAQAASTEADIPSYQITYATSVNRLAVLLGQSPMTLDAVMRKSKPIPFPPSKTAAGVPADVLTNRPDVRAAERQLAQATAKIGQAEANRYPSLSLTGSIDTSATNLADLGKKSTISWSFGPQVSVPIFQGGQLKAAVDVAKAQRDEYFFAYQSSVLGAMEDVENAITSLNRARSRLASLTKSARGYREASLLSKELYEAGSIDLFDVLDAERSLYSAESNAIQAQADIATYYIALNKALGGGWAGPVDIGQSPVADTNEGPHLASNPAGGLKAAARSPQ
ncbi:efflux transporter outer membrane subunit [Rhizobium mongolense]|uniref:efflux transporter outer membrane subunit n=1 Tax=Rhizobium mongolense TaxID=57676 RepID=UPI0003B4BBA3|nr:efflux transporter outer membrane subunit [Rhizobium mongolense]